MHFIMHMCIVFCNVVEAFYIFSTLYSVLQLSYVANLPLVQQNSTQNSLLAK